MNILIGEYIIRDWRPGDAPAVAKYADNPRFNKCYGIQVRGMPGQHPEFTFTVKGGVLTIDTKRATRLGVWLGDEGFGMNGTVTVALNGKEAYKGEPKQVDLDVEQQPAAR
jgi:hypothetical protein